MICLEKYSFTKLRHRLSIKLFVIIFVSSLLVTLLFTGIHLIIQYRQGIIQIGSNVDLVEESYLPSIANSLYMLDENQLSLQLKGALQHRGIEYCEVQEKSGQRLFKVSEGNPKSSRDLVRVVPLKHRTAKGEWLTVGKLTIHASFGSVYDQLWQRASVLMIQSALQIFIAAFIGLTIFQVLVARHLNTMARYTQSLDIELLEPELTLKRTASEDELSQVANAINDLRVRLKQDIVKRQEAEEALRESEARYKDLASFLPLSLFETDDQGNITFANPFAFELTGYTQEDIDKGFNILQVIHPDDHDKILRSMKIIQGVHTEGSEYLIQRKDGSTFPAYIDTNPTIKDHKLKGLKGYIFDLTKQKKAEESLRESEEKLARLKKMESLGLLAGGVAHDLNNVLSGIVGYPELLLLDLSKDSNLRKPIETMQESGNRAVAIVQDLLTVARGVAITKEPLNLSDLVNDYLNSPELKNLKQFHPTVTIKSKLDSSLFNIAGSHVHIRKVVMNLVSNASEAIDGRGIVSLSTANRYVDEPLKGYDDVAKGEYVVLSVSDDGLGISQDGLERIFEPFYTKKVMGRSGTGLGLAVVWNVVQDHEGYIDVKSDENGTTFKLYFPITRDEIVEKVLPIPIKDFKGNGETILVVDDMESQRNISGKMLNLLGYKTIAISSGEEAIEYLKENTIDLVLLDMIMDPGINGRKTYERIIEIHPKQKAIIISGFAESDDVKEAQKLGAGKYIKKPLTIETLGLAVKEELKK